MSAVTQHTPVDTMGEPAATAASPDEPDAAEMQLLEADDAQLPLLSPMLSPMSPTPAPLDADAGTMQVEEATASDTAAPQSLPPKEGAPAAAKAPAPLAPRIVDEDAAQMRRLLEAGWSKVSFKRKARAAPTATEPGGAREEAPAERGPQGTEKAQQDAVTSELGLPAPPQQVIKISADRLTKLLRNSGIPVTADAEPDSLPPPLPFSPLPFSPEPLSSPPASPTPSLAGHAQRRHVAVKSGPPAPPVPPMTGLAVDLKAMRLVDSTGRPLPKTTIAARSSSLKSFLVPDVSRAPGGSLTMGAASGTASKPARTPAARSSSLNFLLARAVSRTSGSSLTMGAVPTSKS